MSVSISKTMSTLKKLLKIVLSVSSTVLLALLTLLYSFQRKLIYLPFFPPDARKYVLNPKDAINTAYRDIELKSLDGTRLNCFWIPYSKPVSNTLIFFQGNAGNIGHRLGVVGVLQRKLKCNVFMLSYRGYGLSEGTPSEAGIKMDASAAIEYVRKELVAADECIILYGQSIGGAVALHITNKYANVIDFVILENTFLSLRKVVGNAYSFLAPFNWLCTELWNSEEEMLQMVRKNAHNHPYILFMSGSDDKLVPPSHMQKLFDIVNDNSETKQCNLVQFPGGDHNNTILCDGYMEVIEKCFWDYRLSREEN